MEMNIDFSQVKTFIYLLLLKFGTTIHPYHSNSFGFTKTPFDHDCIRKCIDIGYNAFSDHFEKGEYKGHFCKILTWYILFSKFLLNEDGDKIHI